MTETIIMRGAYVITDPRLGASGVIQAGAVVIADGTIRETGPFAAIAPKYPDTGVIGDGTQLLMPGLVDAHSHGRGLSQSMARTSSAKSDVVSTTGSAIERRPPQARCMSWAITRRSVTSRERRSTAGVMTTSPGLQYSAAVSCSSV